MATVDIEALWSDIVGESSLAKGGYVGDLLKLSRAHVSEALGKGELTQAEAGQIYTAMIPAAMQNAIGFAMQGELTEAKIKVEEDKLLTSAQQREVLVAQEELYKRQRAGFDDNKAQKLLDSQLNGWSVTFQDTDTTFIPNAVGGGGTGNAEFDESLTAVRKDYYAAQNP